MSFALAAALGAVKAFLGSTIGRYAIIALAGLGVVLYIKWSSYNEGWDDAMAKVRAQQQTAIELALKAREHLRAACERNSDNCVPDDWFRD